MFFATSCKPKLLIIYNNQALRGFKTLNMNFKKSKLITNLESAIFHGFKNIAGNFLIGACYSKMPEWVSEDTVSSYKTYKDLESMNCGFVIRTNNKTKVYKTFKGVINQIKKQ